MSLFIWSMPAIRAVWASSISMAVIGAIAPISPPLRQISGGMDSVAAAGALPMVAILCPGMLWAWTAAVVASRSAAITAMLLLVIFDFPNAVKRSGSCRDDGGHGIRPPLAGDRAPL
ncbi:hypothetical protein D9M68_954890 [compost metagenome]